ncbi:hypothetical protein P3T76_011795 [Phytophthora citrophthora]|uniref:Uncharacterized protein n=1 Tax=Phytophthora citrophthora TaxID=4793 RepID=A0AAD9G822_9STRA|nr:hypothetical protein P3T76_011795 [Phytophthora citrophthora]
MLTKEIEIFNRMLSTSDDRLNVLIVCSTNYSGVLKKNFGEEGGGHSAVYPSDAYVYSFPHVHEVILLNLSTSKLRAKFFAIHDSKDVVLQTALEGIIEKAEVEFDG